jgi:hypothetical protein
VEKEDQDSPMISATFIAALDPYHPSTRGACIVPELQHIDIKTAANHEPIDTLFVEMVRRRWRQNGINSTACLRTAKLDTPKLSETAVYAAETLQMGGMNIELWDEDGSLCLTTVYFAMPRRSVRKPLIYSNGEIRLDNRCLILAT